MDPVNGKKYGSMMINWGKRVTQRDREYPLIDQIVMAYVAVMLLFQILLQISPVVTFLTTTPLYSIQTYLGLLGGGLIVLDLFTTKRIWQGKYSILLYAILALAAIASLRMISYGIKENLFKLCWAAIQFVLVYSCAYRLERETLEKYLKHLFFVLLAIWFIACCVSLYQYVNQIGYMYVVNPLAMDSSANRQGFYDNRLFGIFYTLNHAAYISLFFLLIAIGCMAREKRILVKICLALAVFVLLCYIILSNSRSAAISLLICATIMCWFVARNRIKVDGKKKGITCVIISLTLAVLLIFSYQGMKKCLSQVPHWKSQMDSYLQGDSDDPTQVPATDLPADTTDPTPTQPNVEKPEPEKPDPDEDVLHRDHLDEDASNGRFSIWADYISLYQDVGLIGLSPGNYMPYILEHRPELYIVDYVKDTYPDKYESGIIYHVHSGYMMVYVSAGILGILCLAIFIFLYLLRVIRIILKNQKLSWLFIGAFLLVAAGAISAALDEGLFFQNTPHTTMFWFALGVLTKEQLSQQNANGK